MKNILKKFSLILVIVVLLFSITNSVNAAITFGNTTSDPVNSSTTSHNNNGDFLVVIVNSSSNDVSAVTYAGVSMTQLDSAFLVNWSARYLSTWYLVSPASGANNIVVTGGANLGKEAFSVSGVSSTNPITGLTTTTDQTSNNASISVTTTTDNAYAVAYGQINDATITAGTDTTLYINDTAYALYVVRSTNAVSPAGAITLNYNSTGNWRLRGFGINPPITTSIKTFNGLAKASIKTINNLAIASVKTVLGLP